MQAFSDKKYSFYVVFYDTIPSLTLTKGAVLYENHKRTLISCAMLEDEVNHILGKNTPYTSSHMD
mgnify:CR=1 FL=1